MEPEDCYTVGEVSKLYRVSESTVYSNLRKYGIPMRQLGRFVYVPKIDIDKIFKSEKNEEENPAYKCVGETTQEVNITRNGIYM